jgi:hypothetical protein
VRGFLEAAEDKGTLDEWQDAFEASVGSDSRSFAERCLWLMKMGMRGNVSGKTR